MRFYFYRKEYSVMNRFQAAGLHFLGSAFVLLLLFGLVRWVWYPGPLFTAASGVNLIGLLVLIDVILGPLIMMIIFNPKKKWIKLDIAVVLVLQMGFLLYGASSIFSARPVYIAFLGNQFYALTANEIDDAALKKVTDPQFKRLPILRPVLVGTNPPAESSKEGQEILLSGLGGMGAQNLPQYYVPYSQILPQVQKAAKSIDAFLKIARISAEDRQRLKTYQANSTYPDVAVVPLLCKRRLLFAAVDPKTGAMLDMF
jgi:hypothetical protein